MRNAKERVLAVVRAIPRGQVRTYKQVADQAGCPGAARFVGNIMAANHDPEIPCHRVIRSDGKLGGYNRGTQLKKQRLLSEGVSIREYRVIQDS